MILSSESKEFNKTPSLKLSLIIFQYYFRRWQEEDTEDNFFKWCATRRMDLSIGFLNSSRLDRGGGKDLSLPDCSREQLEEEVHK